MLLKLCAYQKSPPGSEGQGGKLPLGDQWGCAYSLGFFQDLGMSQLFHYLLIFGQVSQPLRALVSLSVKWRMIMVPLSWACRRI